MKKILILVFMIVLAAGIGKGYAVPVTQQIYFTKDTTGSGLTFPATYAFRFSLWTVGAGGTEANEVWGESKNVKMTSAVLSAYLGSVTTNQEVGGTKTFSERVGGLAVGSLKCSILREGWTNNGYHS